MEFENATQDIHSKIVALFWILNNLLNYFAYAM